MRHRRPSSLTRTFWMSDAGDGTVVNLAPELWIARERDYSADLCVTHFVHAHAFSAVCLRWRCSRGRRWRSMRSPSRLPCLAAARPPKQQWQWAGLPERTATACRWTTHPPLRILRPRTRPAVGMAAARMAIATAHRFATASSACLMSTWPGRHRTSPCWYPSTLRRRWSKPRRRSDHRSPDSRPRRIAPLAASACDFERGRRAS